MMPSLTDPAAPPTLLSRLIRVRALGVLVAAVLLLGVGQWTGLWPALEVAASQSAVRVSVSEDGTVRVNGHEVLITPEGAPPAVLAHLEGSPPRQVELVPDYPDESRRSYVYPRLGLVFQRLQSPSSSVPTQALELHGAGLYFVPGVRFRGEMELRGGRLTGDEHVAAPTTKWQDLARPGDTVFTPISTWKLQQGATKLLLVMGPEGELRVGYITFPDLKEEAQE